MDGTRQADSLAAEQLREALGPFPWRWCGWFGQQAGRLERARRAIVACACRTVCPDRRRRLSRLGGALVRLDGVVRALGRAPYWKMDEYGERATREIDAAVRAVEALVGRAGKPESGSLIDLALEAVAVAFITVEAAVVSLTIPSIGGDLPEDPEREARPPSLGPGYRGGPLRSLDPPCREIHPATRVGVI